MKPFVARRNVGPDSDATPELYLVLAFVPTSDRDYPIHAVCVAVGGAMRTFPVDDLIVTGMSMDFPSYGFQEGFSEWLS